MFLSSLARALCGRPVARVSLPPLRQLLVARSSSNLAFSSFAGPTTLAIDDRTFHNAADIELERLLEAFEMLGDMSDLKGFDVTLSSGVLTLALGNNLGTYVINKQPPNKQIWLSSPFSGPARYNYDQQQHIWVNNRQISSSTLSETSIKLPTLPQLLESELKQQLGVHLQLTAQSS